MWQIKQVIFIKFKKKTQMKNVVNLEISNADQDAIKAAIQTITGILTPHLHALTDNERKGGIKMGDKSVAFVEKAMLYGSQFSTQLPAYIDIKALKSDVEAVALLNSYAMSLATVLRGIEDTIILAGGEAMEASNGIYASLKMASQNNISGTQEAYNDMKQRYSSKGRKEKV